MTIAFDYTVQIEAKGKTALGREIQFLLDETFQATLDHTYYDYLSGKVISSDINGDFVPEGIQEQMQATIDTYCMRYSIVASTVEVLSYTVSTNETDVVVYFNPTYPTKRISDGTAKIYAYLYNDQAYPLAPSSVTAVPTNQGITLSWIEEDHHHGIRIYGNNNQLLASLGQGTTEWMHTGIVPGQLYVYDVSAYNGQGESERIRVSIRANIETIPSVIDEQTGEVITSPYGAPSREEGVLSAFQSGVGDLEDMQVVLNKQQNPKEVFAYTMRLKGYQEEVMNIYPEREFQYKLSAHNAFGILLQETPWRIGIVDGKEPMKISGSGKEDLRLSLDISVPGVEGEIQYSVELIDPSGYITVSFDNSTGAYTTHADDYITFSSTQASIEEVVNKVPFYGPQVKGRGTYIVEHSQPLIIDEEIPNPSYDPVLSTKNITEWVIILHTDNPNVKLSVSKEPETYTTDLRFLRFKMAVSIRNHTQTPWNPLIHSGYYYLNQSEHYLFAEHDVQGRIAGDVGFVPLKFIYGIDVTVNNSGTQRTYSTSIAAEISSDQKLYRLGEQPIKEIMNNVLVKNGVNPNDVTIVNYAFTLKDDYPLSLSARGYVNFTEQYVGVEMGDGFVYGQTTGIISQHIYDDLKVKVDENFEAHVKPIPRQGAPLVIQDASGMELTQTFFYDDKGNPTLTYSEEMTSTIKNEILLTYLNADLKSLLLFYLDHNEDWVAITGKDYVIIENYIKLYPSIPAGSRVRASYKLKGSYYVDYNYHIDEDFAKIILHNPNLDDSREIKIIYETSDSPFYIGEEMDLNPLNNIQNQGFIYLATHIEAAQSLDLLINPKTMFANGYDSTMIRVLVKDKFDNPVSGDPIAFSASLGNIEVIQSITDENGMAIAKYTAPLTNGTAIITAVNTKRHIEVRDTIYLKDESLSKRMTLSTSYPTVYPGVNQVEITAHLYGENQEPVAGVPVTFEHHDGLSDQREVLTDQFGAARIAFIATSIPRTGIIQVRAKALGISVDTVLRIEGFRDYHPDYFVQSNNLIDIYERVSARENLGITASSTSPNNPLANDLWIDQGDILYLMQSYELRDVHEREASRQNLGIHVNTPKPEGVWPNDLWFGNEEGEGDA